MSDALSRITIETDLHRENQARVLIGEIPGRKITKFQTRTGGVDEGGVVLTPAPNQNLTGDLIYEKNLIKPSGSPIEGRDGGPVSRYFGELKLLIECHLSASEGQGAISQVIIFDQDENIIIKRNLPTVTKTSVLEFVEQFFYRF